MAVRGIRGPAASERPIAPGLPPRRVPHQEGEQGRAVPAVPPTFCGTGWGRSIWREPVADRTHLATYLCGWDLCEIGYELSRGMIAHTDDWGLWCLSTGASWLQERKHYRLDATDSNQHDAEVFRDIIAMSEVVHVSEYHTYPYTHEPRQGQKYAIHHHGNTFRFNPYHFEQREVNCGYLRLVSTPDLLLYGQQRDTLRWIPSPVPLSEFDRLFPRWEPRRKKDPLRVLHGYTVARSKGTPEFQAAAGRVQKRGTTLDISTYTGLNRAQSLWHISQCDVYFATFLYGPGMASIEAWAFGIPVLAGCTADELAMQRRCYGRELPFIHVTPENIEKVLHDLAHDEDMREEYGRRGRAAAEKYHDTPRVIERLTALYNETKPAKGLVRP